MPNAISYVLEETDALGNVKTYTSPTDLYTVSSRNIQEYCYRVKAHYAAEDGPWSNVECVDVRWELEPENNAINTATGPLNSGLTYYGVFLSDNDEYDYFYFDLTVSTTHTIDIWLTNIPDGTEYDLTLVFPDGINPIHSGNLGSEPEHISTATLQTGRFKILVFHGSSDNGSTQPYNLRVVFTPNASQSPKWQFE